MSDDVKKRSVAQGVARLKELLFDNEAETLEELDKRLKAMEVLHEAQSREREQQIERLQAMFDRVGTDDSFRTNVATVLDRALNEAERRNHKGMSRALAPMVVTTVKTELKNSQDELVEIMHPITGRMVKSYVLAEMKKLSETINSQIDRNPVMLRLRSWTSGRPMSDLAIAHSQRLTVDEVFLIRRGSGELLAHWPPSGTSLSNADVHMSGMLEAIHDFSSSAFSKDGGHIDSFKYDDCQVYLRASPAYLLAAKCNGVAPSGIESIFDDEFLATTQRIAQLEKNAPDRADGLDVTARSAQLEPMASAVGNRAAKIYDDIDRSSIGGALVKMLLFLIAAPLLAWFFWGLYTDAEEGIVRRTAQQVIIGTPGLTGYQTSLDVGYRGKSLTVKGLVPEQAVLDALRSGLARELPGTEVTAEMAVIPRPKIEVVQPVDTTAIERRLAERVSAAERKLVSASARRALARAEATLGQALPELGRLERLIREAGKKADVQELRTVVEKTLADVGSSRTRLDTNRGSDEVADLVAPINRSTAALAGAVKSLASLHGNGQVTVGRHNEGGRAMGVAEAAEELTAQAERLATLALALNQTLAMLPEPVAVQPVPAEPSAEERLRAFVMSRAVFFSTGTELAPGNGSAKVLDEAAALIKQTNGLVRVVGYVDATGDASRNSTLAQERADRVRDELVRRGVPEGQLVAIGRPGSYDLRPGAGEGSPNRRVQFELGFHGEGRGSP